MEKKNYIKMLEKEIYDGECTNLEYFYEVLRYHIDISGKYKKAYSICVMAPQSREIPCNAKNHSVYHWEFDAYFALAAFRAGFHEEAWRIQKNLLYHNPHSVTALPWLTNSYHYYLNKLVDRKERKKYIYKRQHMKQKTAILFVGQYRTFDRTYYNIYKNLIEPNNAKVFVFCETKNSCEKLKNILFDKWGGNYLGGCEVIEKRPDEFYHIVDYLLKTKTALLPNKFTVSARPFYLLGSGSILEYYYFMKCYELMLEYEKMHGITFDILIRSRLDIMIGQKMKIQSFFEKINKPLREKLADDNMYINNLGNEKIAELNGTDLKKQKYQDLLYKINTSNYIWTLGPNQVWIGKRHIMSQMYSIIYTYGKYESGRESTFNAETQFEFFCKERNIHRFWIRTAGGAKYLENREKNSQLLKYPHDEIEDDTIVWTFIRTQGFGFIS